MISAADLIHGEVLALASPEQLLNLQFVGFRPDLVRSLEFVASREPGIIERTIRRGDYLTEELEGYTSLVDWESKFDGQSIGLEKETNIMDADGFPVEAERRHEITDSVSSRIWASEFKGSRCYEDNDGLQCFYDLVEIATSVSNSLSSLKSNLTRLYGWLEQSIDDEEQIMAEGVVSGRILSTQINLGAKNYDEALFIINALRQHLPEFVALFQDSDRITKYGACSDFPEEFQGLEYVESHMKPKVGVYSHPLMLTKKSTIELRCCDSQITLRDDMAIAAYAYAIRELARDCFEKGIAYPIDRNHKILEKMYFAAVAHGIAASVRRQRALFWIEESLAHLNIHSVYGKPVLEKIDI